MIKELEVKGLLLVKSPEMVKRYNVALENLCGFETKLNEFHIDCSGFSPEICEERNGENYLNINGINKKFIIISIDQESLPIYRAEFSYMNEIISKYISLNKKQLMIITSIDCVFGEVENNIPAINNIDDLLNTRTIRFEIETGNGLIETENRIKEIIKELYQVDTHEWLNPNGLLKNLAEQSLKFSGSQKNSLIPENHTFQLECYFTKHLGGLHVIHSNEKTYIIGNKESLEEIKEYNKDNSIVLLDHKNPKEIASVLISLDMVKMRNLSDNNEINEVFMNMMLNEMQKDNNDIYSDIPNKSEVDDYFKRNINSMPETIKSINKIRSRINFIMMKRKLSHSEESLTIEVENNGAIWYSIEATDEMAKKGYAGFIDHLILSFLPYNYRKLFESNRSLFFEVFRKMEPGCQKYVMKTLEL